MLDLVPRRLAWCGLVLSVLGNRWPSLRAEAKTMVTIRDGRWTINGSVTYPGSRITEFLARRTAAV
ncbi:MAG: hypothetical protein ACKV19_20350 [Verrucomicrobiales bacterium]